MTKFNGDPVIWYMEIGGQRIKATTDEMLSQMKFIAKLADKTGRVMAPIAKARWHKWLDQHTRDADVIEVPEDATPYGQFKIILEQYATGIAQARSKDELVIRHAPWRDGGRFIRHPRKSSLRARANRNLNSWSRR
jgi:hypothetical protein